MLTSLLASYPPESLMSRGLWAARGVGAVSLAHRHFSSPLEYLKSSLSLIENTQS